MNCTNATLPLVVAIVGLLLALVATATMLVRRRVQDAGPTDWSFGRADLAPGMIVDDPYLRQFCEPLEVRRVRAGAARPPLGPDPALTVARATAIEQDARSAARVDFRHDPNHRRGNPHGRSSREACGLWGKSYAEEWDQLANPVPLDCSDEPSAFVATQPGIQHGAA